jgi:hypothetical protein
MGDSMGPALNRLTIFWARCGDTRERAVAKRTQSAAEVVQWLADGRTPDALAGQLRGQEASLAELVAKIENLGGEVSQTWRPLHEIETAFGIPGAEMQTRLKEDEIVFYALKYSLDLDATLGEYGISLRDGTLVTKSRREER